MYPPVVTKDPTAVEAEVQAAFLAIFPNADPKFVPEAFGWASGCFQGTFKDYQAVDAAYHDFEHTLQGTLCLARLLRGRRLAAVQPQVTQRMFRLGLLAILLHDTGYLKKGGDTEGTGAKHTGTHVERGVELVAELLGEKGFAKADIKAVQNMILCTGMEAALRAIPFQDDLEEIVGFAVGTADLLGQVAAEDYVERLPALYSEFAEAARFSKDPTHFAMTYSSPEDLMRKTPVFWEQTAQRKLNRDFGGLYRFLNDPYPDGPNEYLERAEANMKRLRERIAATRG